MVTEFKKKMIKKWKRPFSILKKRLLEQEKEDSSGAVVSWELPTALPLLTKDWVRSINDRTHVVDR